MKKLFLLLPLGLLCGTAVLAFSHPGRGNGTQLPRQQKLSADNAALMARSLQLTCYLADMLRLSSQQAGEVRRATLLELQQQRTQSSTQALASYDAALLRILHSDQYRTFRWLEDRQPVANLLVNPAFVRMASR